MSVPPIHATRQTGAQQACRVVRTDPTPCYGGFRANQLTGRNPRQTAFPFSLRFLDRALDNL